MIELEKVYNPSAVEPAMYALWERTGAFMSRPDGTPHDRTFTIVIPPPNVTGALHLGHALNNTLQDILVRYHRMCGFNTLWQPGTDHAGIATQAVVERRIRETEGKTRHELGREELDRRIWAWKDEYEKRILNQLKLMGCSCDWGYKQNGRDLAGNPLYECDWSRTRFTLDDGLARAVRHQFFQLFKDSLIFRGKRLVNWDTELQTAVADDEIYHETIPGKFWHIRYPVIDPKPGEPEYVLIATTRPETMLGDTAVAVNPDPTGALDKMEAKLREELRSASAKDRAEIELKLAAVAERRASHLAELTTLARMARDGREVRLPLVEREIPLIVDEWADPLLGSGCVKITPAHDPNDYEVGVRNQLPMINVMTPDGKIAPLENAEENARIVSLGLVGMTFANDGRQRIVEALEARGLIQLVEDRDREVGHSDRSKTAIEPYLSDQWFIRTGEDEGTEGIRLADGSVVSGLAQAAMDAATDGRIAFFPARYEKTYLDWLGEKRDWCISRQLWWGHRIAIWPLRQSPTIHVPFGQAHEEFQGWLDTQCENALSKLLSYFEAREDITWQKADGLIDGNRVWYLCSRTERGDLFLRLVIERLSINAVGLNETDPDAQRYVELVKTFREAYGQEALDAVEALSQRFSATHQDPDVLDTWFSSALWPFSTLGWPEETPHLKQYYPGSVLVTSRDIITNWVARMVMFGLYAMGKVPFDRVYITPKVLDGRGETMSKSKGNGVDPVDIIHLYGADALRYSIADMTTESQDIRMPVEYVCPHCGKLTDQTLAIKAEEQSRKSRGQKLERKIQPSDCLRVRCSHKECNKDFATQWANAALKQELGLARETSEKFEIGRNFCNKLWNAARFAFMNLEGTTCAPIDISQLNPEDRWVLARLSKTIHRIHVLMDQYQFSAMVKELRDFFWDALCDWYIELVKPRLVDKSSSHDSRSARQALAFCLDQTLRLWHPFIPFITEKLWGTLNELVPRRGFPGLIELRTAGELVAAEYPPKQGYPLFDDDRLIQAFENVQDVVRGVRDLRSRCNVAPKEPVRVTVALPESENASFAAYQHIVRTMAGISELAIDPAAKRPANAGSVALRSLRVFVHDISNDEAERQRTRKSLADVERQISGKESKLKNEKFVSNADPDLVAQERDRLADLLKHRNGLLAHLAELND